MAKKSGEELFIEDGEWKEPALRGAYQNWVDRDWEYAEGREQKIGTDPEDPSVGAIFQTFQNWVNRKIDEHWWKDLKEDYGSEKPNEVFKEYYNNNEDFRWEVRSHIKGTDEWYERRGEDPSWDEDDGEDEGEEEDDADQSSFGASQYPQLYELGVVNDSGNLVQSKLRGLAVAFSKDVEEIKGEDREFAVDWVIYAFLEWGKDKFGEEWLRLLVDHVASMEFDEAIMFVYNNNDDANRNFHKKYSGNEELGPGKAATDDAAKAFLDAEVPNWGTDEDEQEKKGRKDHWDEFEEQSNKHSEDKGGSQQGESSSSVGDDSSESDGDNPADSVGTVEGDQWKEFEKKAEELEYEEPEKEENDDTEQDGQRTGDDSDSEHPGRERDRDGGDDGSNDGTLAGFAKELGTTEEIEKPSRTRDGNTSSRSKKNRTTKKVEKVDDGPEMRRPNVQRMDDLERNKIYRGNVYEWASKLPENSVDTIVTSPPYWALRDYDIEDAVPVAGDFTCDHNFEDQTCTECGAWLGQLGAEDNPALFIDHIVDLMERLREVLKPTGSLWLNIGDTYAGENIEGRVSAGEKSRIMVPDRVYVRLVEEGWRLRNYVIWGKKIWMPGDDLRGNGKPFASGSRLADQWEPMVNLTPSADNYSDVDSNRLRPPSFDGDLGKAAEDTKFRENEDTRRGRTYNPLGTNPSDVWLVNGDGRNVDHRAVFPEELPKRCINISTPDRVCKSCGVPFTKEVHVEEDTVLSPGGDYATYEKNCNCNAGHEPGIVMDPFLGSGTTGIAAANNGYDWIGVELSDKYAEIAKSEIPTGRQQGLNQFGD